MFSLDASGKLKIESKKADVSADTSTEILLQFALQRRGLSMDQANLRVAAVGRGITWGPAKKITWGPAHKAVHLDTRAGGWVGWAATREYKGGWGGWAGTRERVVGWAGTREWG